MARSQISVASPAFNAASTVTADAVDVSNEHYIDLAGLDCEQIGIRLYGGTGAGFTAVFKAGDYPDGAAGDLTVAVAANAINVIKVESARFKDSDKYILIDCSSTGTATAATFEAYEIK